MPKHRDLRIGTALFYECGYEREMIILHQYDRPLDMAHFFEKRLGEQTVHFTVLKPVLFSKLRPHMCHMTERPQGVIGKTVIISFDFLGSEPYALQSIFWLVRGDLELAFRIRRFFVRVPASIRDPCTTACLHNWLNSSYHSTCREKVAYFTSIFNMYIWLSI